MRGNYTLPLHLRVINDYALSHMTGVPAPLLRAG